MHEDPSHSQQDPPAPAYYGLSGYTAFPTASVQLQGAGESLSFSFRSCLSDGVLIHATDSSGESYFSVGVYDLQLLIAFRNGGRLGEVIHVANEVAVIIFHK